MKSVLKWLGYAAKYAGYVLIALEIINFAKSKIEPLVNDPAKVEA